MLSSTETHCCCCFIINNNYANSNNKQICRTKMILRNNHKWCDVKHGRSPLMPFLNDALALSGNGLWECCSLFAVGPDRSSANIRHLASRKKTWSLVLILVLDWFCQKHPAKDGETLGQCHHKVIMKSWEDSQFQHLSGPVILIGWNLVSIQYIH